MTWAKALGLFAGSALLSGCALVVYECIRLRSMAPIRSIGQTLASGCSGAVMMVPLFAMLLSLYQCTLDRRYHVPCDNGRNTGDSTGVPCGER